MVCPGGEAAFVTQMVQDSLQLQKRIHWFTTMVGKKATLKKLRAVLHGHSVTALRTTEFVQVSSRELSVPSLGQCCGTVGQSLFGEFTQNGHRVTALCTIEFVQMSLQERFVPSLGHHCGFVK